MTDRELLELAAKAAGYDVAFWPSRNDAGFECGFLHAVDGGIWNPLTDDGDALRLAVKLQMQYRFITTYCEGVEAYTGYSQTCYEKILEDRGQSLRRSIVRAAAEIGKGM